MAAAAEVAATQPAETGQASSTTMPKKPQHLSLAGVATTAGGLKAPAKYSLTLHNNKYATSSGRNGSTSTLRDNQQQQRQHHLKALRLTRDVGNSNSDQATANGDYKRPGLTGLSPGSEDVGVHLSRAQQAAAVNGEASTTTTTTTTKLTGNASGNGNGIGIGIGNGNANPLANGAMRTQNNRLWYH